MCKERHRTRDLLLEYDSTIMPVRPRAAGLTMVYPWENVSINTLISQLYQFAENSGFIGTEKEFKEHFGAYLSDRSIIYANFNNFPEVGEKKKLYFDLIDKILYYWDDNKYIPINAMIIANTKLNGGEA